MTMAFGAVLFTLALLLLVTSQPIQASICIHYHDPLDGNQYTVMDCQEVYSNRVLYNKNATLPLITMDAATIDPFTIDFSCDINDSTKCRLAEEVCKRAGTMLASILDIVQPISVKVMFVSFCQTYGKCGSTNGGGSIILGNSIAVRSSCMFLDIHSN